MDHWKSLCQWREIVKDFLDPGCLNGISMICCQDLKLKLRSSSCSRLSSLMIVWGVWGCIGGSISSLCFQFRVHQAAPLLLMARVPCFPALVSATFLQPYVIALSIFLGMFLSSLTYGQYPRGFSKPKELSPARVGWQVPVRKRAPQNGTWSGRVA